MEALQMEVLLLGVCVGFSIGLGVAQILTYFQRKGENENENKETQFSI